MTKAQDNLNRLPTDHIGVLVAGVLMMVVGWGGLFWLVSTQVPQLGVVWMFYLFLHLAVTGTVLPVVRYLNMRFTPVTAEPPPGGVIVRQSVWLGLFAIIIAWLQVLRVLSIPTMFFLALVFIVLEVFLRARERNTA
jgi:hypothetical protein